MIKMRGNNPILAIKTTHFAPYHDGIYPYAPSNLYNSSSVDEMIKMRGNNPILALKLYILLCILMKSIHMSFKHL